MPPPLLTAAECGIFPIRPLTPLGQVAIDVAHHTVTNAYVPPCAGAQQIDAIHKSNGWGFAGYCYMVNIDGTIVILRGPHVGVHTAGWNSSAEAVVFQGNFMVDPLTHEAVESYRWLRDERIRNGELAPGIYPTWGHFQAPGNSTACPGTNVINMLDVLRQPYEGLYDGGQQPPDKPKRRHRFMLLVSNKRTDEILLDMGTHLVAVTAEEAIYLINQGVPGLSMGDARFEAFQTNFRARNPTEPIKVVRAQPVEV